MKTRNLFLRLVESYVFVLFASLGLGLALPAQAGTLAPYSTFFLGAIFFLSALKIDFKEFSKYLKDEWMLVVVNAWMLVILPIIVYMFARLLVPDLALAFLLLAAMPAGMTSPLLAEIAGGRQSLALVLTITTSLLAPFTIPLVIKLLAGATVMVSFFTMFLSLAKVIFVPFALALVVKRIWHHKIKATYYTFKPISILLLGLLIAGVVAKQADVILHGLNASFIRQIVALFILFILFHVFGYFTVFWHGVRDRMTVTVCVTYLNFTLAIYLAGTFFNDPRVTLPVVLSVLPWSLLMLPFRQFGKRFLRLRM